MMAEEYRQGKIEVLGEKPAQYHFIYHKSYRK
jgi:hypothetical protein